MNKYIEVYNTDGEPVLILKDSIVMIKITYRDWQKATAITVVKDKYYEFIYTYTSYKRIKDLLISGGDD